MSDYQSLLDSFLNHFEPDGVEMNNDTEDVSLACFVAEMVLHLCHDIPFEFNLGGSNFTLYCSNILSIMNISPSAILVALEYIQRLKANCPSKVTGPDAEYVILVVALMLAHKFQDDNTYSNQSWAVVSKLPLAHINSVEVDFLSSVDFDLYVSEAEYIEWLNYLEQYLNQYESFTLDDNLVYQDMDIETDYLCDFPELFTSDLELYQYTLPVSSDTDLMNGTYYPQPVGICR
ncbi:hypothetical protein K7432_014872 [Basidiobolus ranarum]|uniref:Cyclin N-terminal domain-containing protein n=1 Tax=Basidiobolus ranarum TaxID=34480 RepID=A0ABR2VNV8_9FUNG